MSLSLSRLTPEQLIPKIGHKIVLTALTHFGQLRLNEFGNVWIIKKLSVYDPPRYTSSDPEHKFQGLLTLSITPRIELIRTFRIGFPLDSDFSWMYLQDTVRNL